MGAIEGIRVGGYDGVADVRLNCWFNSRVEEMGYRMVYVVDRFIVDTSDISSIGAKNVKKLMFVACCLDFVVSAIEGDSVGDGDETLDGLCVDDTTEGSPVRAAIEGDEDGGNVCVHSWRIRWRFRRRQRWCHSRGN